MTSPTMPRNPHRFKAAREECWLTLNATALLPASSRVCSVWSMPAQSTDSNPCKVSSNAVCGLHLFPRMRFKLEASGLSDFAPLVELCLLSFFSFTYPLLPQRRPLLYILYLYLHSFIFLFIFVLCVWSEHLHELGTWRCIGRILNPYLIFYFLYSFCQGFGKYLTLGSESKTDYLNSKWRALNRSSVLYSMCSTGE